MAGDARRGLFRRVPAIGKGGDAVRAIDHALTGATGLPASPVTPDPPLPPRGLKAER